MGQCLSPCLSLWENVKAKGHLLPNDLHLGCASNLFDEFPLRFSDDIKIVSRLVWPLHKNTLPLIALLENIFIQCPHWVNALSTLTKSLGAKCILNNKLQHFNANFRCEILSLCDMSAAHSGYSKHCKLWSRPKIFYYAWCDNVKLGACYLKSHSLCHVTPYSPRIGHSVSLNYLPPTTLQLYYVNLKARNLFTPWGRTLE